MSGEIVISSGPISSSGTYLTVPSSQSISIGGNTMQTNYGICPTVTETYAWAGFNFLIICAGVFILIGAGCLAYSVFKSWNKIGEE